MFTWCYFRKNRQTRHIITFEQLKDLKWRWDNKNFGLKCSIKVWLDWDSQSFFRSAKFSWAKTFKNICKVKIAKQIYFERLNISEVKRFSLRDFCVYFDASTLSDRLRWLKFRTIRSPSLVKDWQRHGQMMALYDRTENLRYGRYRNQI